MKTILTILLLLNVELISQIKFIGNPSYDGYSSYLNQSFQNKSFPWLFMTMGHNGFLFWKNDFKPNAKLINTPFQSEFISINYHRADSLIIFFNEPKGLDKRDIYISQDGGITTAKILENATTDLILNPMNSDILFAGFNKKELWRSNDRGKNWFKIYTFERKVYSLAVSETDTSLIYAGLLNGIRRSTDSGISWETIYDTTGNIYFEFDRLIINPQNNNSVFVGLNKLYKLYYGLPWLIPIVSSSGVGNFTVEQTDSNHIYYVGNNNLFPGQHIFKTTNGGDIWIPISNTVPIKMNLVVEIDIDNNDRNTLYVNAFEGGILKSTDGGISWSRTNFVHDRAFKMDFGNSNRIFTVGSPWGLMKTDNDGETWDLADIVPDSLLYKKPEYVAINPFNRNEGFLTINYKLLKTTNGGNSFVQQSTNEGWTWIMYNPHFQNILYGIIMPGYSTEYGVFKSTDGGLSWNLNSLFANPKSFSPKNENKLYTYGIDSWGIGVLYVSQNGGLSWTNNISGLRKYSGSTDPLPVSAVIESYHDSNIVYCGQWGDGMGSISKSTNGGESWFQIDASFPEQNKYVHCMLLDKNKPGRFYVGAQSGLYLTENDGQTWRKLFNKNVYDLMMDSSQPPNIYLNTHAGVLKLVDTVTVDVKEKSISQPETFVLYQNYPNPFNPVTTIRYQIPKSGRVSLKVYDILGKGIATLVNEEKETGRYTVRFDASNLSSGVYLYEIVVNDYRAVKKLMVTK